MPSDFFIKPFFLGKVLFYFDFRDAHLKFFEPLPQENFDYAFQGIGPFPGVPNSCQAKLIQLIRERLGDDALGDGKSLQGQSLSDAASDEG
ncbi:MAG: hypothetical protein K2P90_01030 [Holosporales bacterium]|nr:hypothetical protein [Holosporales bacterium]